jgi:UDP-4-amino-4,6-dideoxy-N-acetyl-beta-L-altrosamine N-acetyltransferase
MLNFSTIQEEQLALILKWRTSADVTRYMFTDIDYDPDAQRKWYQKLLTDRSSQYWMISYNGQDIGVIYLNAIDHANRHCEWGYYIGEASARSLGGLIPLYLYNYVFHELKFLKIIAQVMEGNDNVMKLHEMFGYRLVGRYEKHIYKYGAYHDVLIYELLESTWNSLKKYKRFTAEFEPRHTGLVSDRCQELNS